MSPEALSSKVSQGNSSALDEVPLTFCSLTN